MDTDTAGDFTAEFQIDLSDGRRVTYPQPTKEPGKSFVTVTIGADLGD
jgi:hypothetical protein